MKKTKAKNKKISIILIILILIIGASVMNYASSIIDDPIIISFQDKNLYNAIKLHFETEGFKYNLNENQLSITVSEEELNEIQELNLKGTEGAKISDATGIESFTNLKKINLANNNITDITPLSNLDSLVSIDISNNPNVNLYNKTNVQCYLPNQTGLEELYISSTNNSDISFVSKLTNLNILDVSNNGISVLTPLKSLKNIQVLNVSNNTAITTIDDLLSLISLKDLNISTTGITSLLHSDYEYDVFEYGIFVLTSLQSLNVENNKLSIEPVYKTYTNSDYEEEVYLKSLKKLNFNYTQQSNVDYYGLAKLENLTHLYMKGNDIYYISEDITSLKHLEYINLADNNIEDISGFVKYTYDENGNQIVESTLQAEQIILENNRIQDISPLAKFDHDITYLDLSSNVVFYVDAIDFGRFSFSEGLDLTRQGRDHYNSYGEEELIWIMDVKKKSVDVNQYIILPTLFQNSKNNRSVVYSNNKEFSMENITLNPNTKYHVPGYYNVIIEPPKEDETDELTLSITLNGGCADDSILHFRLTEDTSSIDSLFFEDENLADAIDAELTPRIDEYTYVKRALDILNITNSLIYETDTLHLENKNISNLSGLSSFENLENLYLSNNNISSIDEIKNCQYMEELYVPNNPKLGNNISAIENMTNLVKLDLSTIGMTSIQSIHNLMTKWQEDYYYPLTYLNLSNNTIGNINNIGKITSLEELYISNIGIEDIGEVKDLTALKTLNASGNQIEDISPLTSLIRLKYLTISSNKIQDITPISKISLDSLDFSNNKVKDISTLTKTYTTIRMDTNQISDISNFDGKLIQNFSVTNQKISQAIESEENEDIIIPLPEIFKDSRNSSSKVYTASTFSTTNCELTTDGESVVVNPEELGTKIATVKIVGGNANSTTFSIAAPLKGTITYNPSIEGPTNKNITATISFDRNVTILNNDGKNTYEFTGNGEFTFEYEDDYGFTGSQTAVVSNIDKQEPQAEMNQKIKDGKIIVTIEVNEEIEEISGWTKTTEGTKVVITKTYENDASETVKLVDLAGNEKQIKVNVKIDKIAPVITGVEDGEIYDQSVTPVIEDENLDTVKLTKDGNVVTNYQSGTEIKDAGKYELTAIDTFGNTITVSFEIEISDIITSTSLSIDEETLIVRDINPKTTVQDLKLYLQADMEYEIIDKNQQVVSGLDKVGTGYKIKMDNDKTYTLIVKGDINGDGQISVSDLSRISRIYVSPKANPSEIEILAIDISKDGNIKVDDLAAISRLYNKG